MNYEDDDDYREDYDRDDDDFEWGCLFGPYCLAPSYDHMKSECYTKEMAEEWAEGYA